ncbi:SDR family NAD(P)-dependent oxidoreductase [Staphylococcus auricularis]|uniref:SDR family NAD(P)-dependent oxidoreductase n=1 Tax=Staphylococcus auricularis TaxID=29379 RepID=UPI003EBF3C95
MIGQHFILTGATSGLGRALLTQLLQKRVTVTALVRHPEYLTAFDHYIENNQLNLIMCDLQNETAILELESQLKNHTYNGLIYCAGMGYFKSMSQHDFSEVKQTYMLNVVHFNLLLNVLEPHLVEHPTIVGIGSQAAHVTQAHASHYGASKAAFIQTLNALRLERPSYHVLTVNTGPIATPFHQKADPTLAYAKSVKPIMLDPDALAQSIIKGMINGKEEINKPKWMHLLLKGYQLAPRWIEKLCPQLFNNKS